MENCEFWAKTDLTNAFDQVLLAPGLRRLFGTTVLNPTNRECEAYIWNVLPQSWCLSPMFFEMVVGELKAVTQTALELQGIAPVVQLKNLPDDLVTAGPTQPRSDASSDDAPRGSAGTRLPREPREVHHCDPAHPGRIQRISLDGCLVQPTATRKPIVDSFAQSAWDDLMSSNLLDFAGSKVDQLHWLRSIASELNIFESKLDRLDLRADHRKRFGQNTVEFVKAAPESRLREPRQERPHREGVQSFSAVKDNTAH